ncbi:T9SS type A sorting domain-containing protein, partial [candidate division KSB1 bacterium]|nr:T9SS type A sorting domain-containing protein [candidate division KSB1 bacterium]
PPAIIHNSVDSAMVGFDINIHCEAFDTTNYLTSVQLNFRKTGTLLYNAVDMTHTNQIAYAAKIPVPFVTFDGVDYFLSATDDMGITSTHGTKDEPHQIYVYQNPDPPVRIVIEAEEMQNRFHGTPCDSGWILTHQDYPIYEVTHFGIHTFWRFTIIARADIGNNIAPWLKVKLDTVFVGTCEIASTQWKPYTFVAQVPTGDHRLDLQYLNDWWNVDDDRNLLLDKIIIEPIQSSGSRMQYVFEAENMVSYAPGRQVDDCWKFDSGGLMVHQLFLERQSYPVSIIARGDSSEGSWPRITVYVDGRPIAMAAIDSPVLKEYQFQLTVIVPGDHYLSIYYSNHVWRQALYIDKVIFYVNDGGLLKPEPDIKHENDATNLLPQTMTLAQNYPNPFNSGTVIKYQIPRRTVVMLKIYNYIGQELITLADGERAPGYYSIFWNGTNENQMKLPSGIYFYKLVTEETCITRKMLLLQ